MRYEIIVSNIGLVFETDSFSVANRVFDEYVDSSKYGTGKAFNEEVTMLTNGILTREFIPAEINQDEVREYPRGRLVELNGDQYDIFSDKEFLEDIVKEWEENDLNRNYYCLSCKDSLDGCEVCDFGWDAELEENYASTK